MEHLSASRKCCERPVRVAANNGRAEVVAEILPVVLKLPKLPASFIAGNTELRESIFQVIRRKRLAEQIGRGTIVVSARGFCSQFVPILYATVTPSKPDQRD